MNPHVRDLSAASELGSEAEAPARGISKSTSGAIRACPGVKPSKKAPRRGAEVLGGLAFVILSTTSRLATRCYLQLRFIEESEEK